MLLYAYFAKRASRKEDEFRARQEQYSPDSANTPHLVITDQPDDAGENEKSPISLTDGSQTPGGTLSPSRTAPAPGLTPLDSHISSAGATQSHHEHPDVRYSHFPST